jgi:hypothetical protein
MTETELNEHISHTLSHSKRTLPQEESDVRRRHREGRATNRQPFKFNESAQTPSVLSQSLRCSGYDVKVARMCSSLL